MRGRHLLPLLLLTGCSFALVRGPGRAGPAECTRGYWLPATDAVLTPTIATLGAVGAVGCVSAGPDCALKALGFGLATVATLTSSIYGFVAVSQCRDTEKPAEQGPPPPPPRDLACEQRRAELREAALAEPDLGKRTKLLQALPSCGAE